MYLVLQSTATHVNNAAINVKLLGWGGGGEVGHRRGIELS